MSNNNVSDPITDQEMAFAHLILSGTTTDRQAAEAVGLNPDTAVDTKSKPRVIEHMLKLRAVVQQQFVEQATEGIPRFSVGRDEVLTRLWEIANMAPERIRNSMSSQVRAISMIVAIEGLIPDRRAVSAKKQPVPPPDPPAFYKAEWLRNQQNGNNVGPEQQQSAPGCAEEPPPPVSSPGPDPTPNLSSPLNPIQNTSSVPRVPMADYVAPDTRQPFKIEKNRFGRRR
jgi:hypothetical protein